MDILTKNDSGNRVPTQKGKEMGIVSEEKISMDGRTYRTNFYSENMQRYIYNNIRNIINNK